MGIYRQEDRQTVRCRVRQTDRQRQAETDRQTDERMYLTQHFSGPSLRKKHPLVNKKEGACRIPSKVP